MALSPSTEDPSPASGDWESCRQPRLLEAGRNGLFNKTKEAHTVASAFGQLCKIRWTFEDTRFGV